jgi:antitoxin ParD1/3/4
MNVSLPPPLRAWIDQQVRRSGFGTASEFIRHLVRQAKARDAEFEDSLIAAMKGPHAPMTDADWKGIEREANRRVAVVRRTRAASARRGKAR